MDRSTAIIWARKQPKISEEHRKYLSSLSSLGLLKNNIPKEIMDDLINTGYARMGLSGIIATEEGRLYDAVQK